MMELKVKLQKNYNGRTALDVETSFNSGGIHVILGPNGSGKTTLLRLLANVIAPDNGSRTSYLADGREITPDGQSHPGTVLAPDRNGLFNDTVFKNAAYGLAIRKKTKAEIVGAVEKSLHAVNLWEMKDENALHLSNGEAQRLCLAMAMTIDPHTILLDEPTASLDPGNAALIEEIILTMRAGDRIIVLVTHNLFQARRMASHIGFLYNGRLIENRPAEEFFANPQTAEAELFLSGSLVY